MSSESPRRPSGTSCPSLAPVTAVTSFAPQPTMARRRSRVRFDDGYASSTIPHTSVVLDPSPDNVSRYPIPPNTSDLADRRATAPEWHIPVYGGPNTISDIAQSSDGAVIKRVAELAIRPESGQSFSVGPFDIRRGSSEGKQTLYGDEDQYRKFSLSSYQHPYDIPAPANVFSGRVQPEPYSSRPEMRSPENLVDASSRHQRSRDSDIHLEGNPDTSFRPHNQRRGLISAFIDLYSVNHGSEAAATNGSRRPSETYSEFSTGQASGGYDNVQGEEHTNFQVIDADDPSLTGVHKEFLEDPEDRRMQAMRLMDYKQRRKERAKITIEFNISSILNRQLFLIKLARALMTFGAASHRIESQLIAAAKILEVEAEFIHLPGVIICSFGDEGTKTSETHFVKCAGRLSLGSLHQVHHIYRAVVHDELSAKKATKQLDELLHAEPLYPVSIRCILAFILSALICPLAFGGSFLDMWIAGAGAFILCLLQLSVATKNAMYANVFEITIAIIMSFSARALSCIRSQHFCYTAISSASIIGILPGYLILTSSLELASKNVISGSVKMVYALIYTLFLGFGLQIGSDLYLLFDDEARHELQVIAAAFTTTTTFLGNFAVDNNETALAMNSSIPLTGTFTFTEYIPSIQAQVVDGCFRLSSLPWYLQPFPMWTQFVIVPIFSIFSSLANLQPWRDFQLVVMVIISCASYSSNKIANHYIFNRSDIVSAIGAFTVGLLGNIYSRKFNGTAFTSMVTGVLFLVPSGLSQAGGITANGNGIDIGGAMIAVTIGITVGLFMSQALVYMVGSRKNAAVFSF